MFNYKFNKISLRNGLWKIWPAIAVLITTLIISIFIAEFTYVTGLKALWVVIFRFVRLLLILTLSLLFLKFVCKRIGSLLNRGNGRLVRLEEMRDYTFAPSKFWLIRPLQGIALLMLIASKVIMVLQLYTPTIGNATALPPIQFDPWRLLVVSLMVAASSLLLSLLWALDDLGIRYFNRKSKEIKMLGKYLGVLLPVFFGFYGIVNLFEAYEYLEAAQYIVQMIIIYYPPFVIFSVLHSYYIRKNEAALIKQLGAEPYVVSIDEKGMRVTGDRI